jgi:hypothetical protein
MSYTNPHLLEHPAGKAGEYQNLRVTTGIKETHLEWYSNQDRNKSQGSSERAVGRHR